MMMLSTNCCAFVLFCIIAASLAENRRKPKDQAASVVISSKVSSKACVAVSFTKSKGHRLPGGILQEGKLSLVKCKKLCEKKKSGCFSVDFHRKNKECWLHLDDTVRTGKVSKSKKWDHYEKICDEGSTSTSGKKETSTHRPRKKYTTTTHPTGSTSKNTTSTQQTVIPGGKTIDELLSEVAVDSIDGDAVVELDIRVPSEHGEGGNRKKRNMVTDRKYRWTNNEVPFIISPGFTQDEVKLIEGAIAEWMLYTCIVFRPMRPGDKPYIEFKQGKGCNSFVGMISSFDNQTINLGTGCLWHGTVVHEIGHALGLYHEHQRTDRDSYVTMHWDKIQAKFKFAFNFTREESDTHNTRYGYYSVMHYGQKAFALEETTIPVTITTKDPSMQDIIGKRAGVTFIEAKKINSAYSCNKKCSDVSCAEPTAYQDKTCACMCYGAAAGVIPCSLTGLGNYVCRYGEDCQHNDIEHSKVLPRICAEKCDSHPSCVAFVTSAQGDCWLKSLCDFMSENRERTTCFNTKAVLHYNDKDCPGNDIIGIGGVTLIECLDLCESYPDCAAMQYNSYSVCWLKHTCYFDKLVDIPEIGNIYQKPAHPPCTEDDNSRCASMARSGDCENNFNFMRLSCIKSCKMCPPPCTDEHSSCSFWARTGECEKNPRYMHYRCKKSCQIC